MPAKKVSYTQTRMIHHVLVPTKFGDMGLGKTIAHPSWVLSVERVAESISRLRKTVDDWILNPPF